MTFAQKHNYTFIPLSRHLSAFKKNLSSVTNTNMMGLMKLTLFVINIGFYSNCATIK